MLCAGEMFFDRIANELFAGGAPANVAIALRRLAVPSAFAGCIGNDAKGDELMRVLAGEGVRSYAVQRTNAAPTRTVDVRHDASGERAFVGFGGAQPGEFADALFAREALPHDLLGGIAFVVVGSLELAYATSAATIASIVRDAAALGIAVVFDVNRRPMFWPDADRPYEHTRTRALLDFATFVKAGDDEARWLFGTDRPADIVAAHPHMRGAVITAGSGPIAYQIDGESGQVVPPSVAVIDTTGAGDAFTAGLIAGLFARLAGTNGGDVHEILRFAAAVGALATTRRGAISALPTRQEVDRFLTAGTR